MPGTKGFWHRRPGRSPALRFVKPPRDPADEHSPSRSGCLTCCRWGTFRYGAVRHSRPKSPALAQAGSLSTILGWLSSAKAWLVWGRRFANCFSARRVDGHYSCVEVSLLRIFAAGPNARAGPQSMGPWVALRRGRMVPDECGFLNPVLMTWVRTPTLATPPRFHLDPAMSCAGATG